MMKHEFELLTGVAISERLYTVVEKYYMLTSIPKQAFVSRHFVGCASEHDIYAALRIFAVEYYPFSTSYMQELIALGACRRSGQFDIG